MPNNRRAIPIPPEDEDIRETGEDALRDAVEDAVQQWDETRDSASGMLDAERKDDESL